MNQDSGLIPRVLKDLIEGLEQRSIDNDDVRVTLSFVEIYNEKIRDLLASSDTPDQATTLRVREHPMLGPYVEGVSKLVVNGNLEKALKLLATGGYSNTTLY